MHKAKGVHITYKLFCELNTVGKGMIDMRGEKTSKSLRLVAELPRNLKHELKEDGLPLLDSITRTTPRHQSMPKVNGEADASFLTSPLTSLVTKPMSASRLQGMESITNHYVRADPPHTLGRRESNLAYL